MDKLSAEDRVPEVSREFENAQNGAKRLVEEVGALLERLKPVMREMGPGVAGSDKVKQPERSTSMSQKVGELGDTIWEQVERVRYAITRIEL
jgi:hypothetical protein